jgi:hypothetical protein
MLCGLQKFFYNCLRVVSDCIWVCCLVLVFRVSRWRSKLFRVSLSFAAGGRNNFTKLLQLAVTPQPLLGGRIALSSMRFFCSPAAAAAPVNLPANWQAKKFSFFHVDIISSIQPIFGTATTRINFRWKSVSSFNYKLFEALDDCLSLYDYLWLPSYHKLLSKVRDRHKI